MDIRRLRWLALPFALLALSNLSKPFEMTDEVGFVFLGRRLDGSANAVAGPAMGLFLAAYAWSLWNRRRAALPLALAYAAWVPLNMALFTIRSPEELAVNSLFGTAYVAVAMTVSWGAALAVWKCSGQLR